jgi:hypothetical protein
MHTQAYQWPNQHYGTTFTLKLHHFRYIHVHVCKGLTTTNSRQIFEHLVLLEFCIQERDLEKEKLYSSFPWSKSSLATPNFSRAIHRHYFGHRYYSTQQIRKHYYFGNWFSMQSPIGVIE